MKQGQSPRRARGRGKRNNAQAKSKDGVTGETKLKGNPKQLLDKYKSLAKDAQQGGDRILAEGYLQHADHYQRVINERAGRAEGILRDPRSPDPDAQDGNRDKEPNSADSRLKQARKKSNGRDPSQSPQPRERRDEREVEGQDKSGNSDQPAQAQKKSAKDQPSDKNPQDADQSADSDAAA